jgi:hypothetical protein
MSRKRLLVLDFPAKVHKLQRLYLGQATSSTRGIYTENIDRHVPSEIYGPARVMVKRPEVAATFLSCRVDLKRHNLR